MEEKCDDKQKRRMFYPSWMKMLKIIGDNRSSPYTKELAGKLNSYSNVNVVLRLFEMKGLIVKTKDGKSVYISLTKKGRQVCSALDQIQTITSVKIIEEYP